MRLCRKLLNHIRLQVLVNLPGSVKNSNRLVPHELTPQQSAKRLEFCENY
ncbi:unnamed protein product [Nezara viridula]|uniref:Uncharacterized protein n=1 Tax=Nezara viridula TaxID=85310 RepID=A0A9P0HL09_NEZVI|nr:unnamed protein product [Nezara viridula]